MTLSVCMIARNEEERLPRALRSISGVADEVIVTDTGSTDRTVDVARELGARVSHFAWCDDFSAARNHAISLATGEWVLWLDADEELLASSIPVLRQCLTRADALAFYIRRHDLTDLLRPDCYTIMWQMRLFRRRDELRFIGRCHPHFEPPIEELASGLGLRVGESDVAIRHDGFVDARRPEKLRRAARLLELELRDRPGQLYYLVEYGRTLLALNDARGHGIMAQAAGDVLRAVEQSRPLPTLASAVLEYLMQLPSSALPAGWTEQRISDAVQRWFPDCPPLVWLRAQRAYGTGRFEEAEGLLRRLIELGRTHSYPYHISFDPSIVGRAALLNLGVCLVRQSRLDEAASLLEGLRDDPDVGRQAKENLATISDLRRRFGVGQ